MHFEEIKRQHIQISTEFWKPPLAYFETPRDLLFSQLQNCEFENIAELGHANEAFLANKLLAIDAKRKYLSYELNPQMLELVKKQSPNLHFQLAPITCELPLADSSQDLFLTIYLLEFLRMDQFYMVCSEARRMVRPGKYWAIINLSPPEKIADKLIAFTRNKIAAIQPDWMSHLKFIDINHYISPEDWEVMKQDTYSTRGTPSQITLLKRL